MAERFGGAGRVSTKSKLMNELIILGQVLVRTRERKKLKQSDAAARLGVPASYLSKIENGTRRLDVIELIRIAEVMETDPCTILAEVRENINGNR